MLRFFDYGFGYLSAGSPLGPAQWPHFDLLAVHGGSLELGIGDDVPTSVSAGDALLIYTQTPFSGVCSSPCRFSVQHFQLPTTPQQPLPSVLQRLQGRRAGYLRYRFACPGPLERDIGRAVRLAWTNQTPTVHELRVAQLLILLGELAGHAPGRAAGVAVEWQPLLDWIQEHLGQPITLTQMARIMEMSPSRFRLRFRDAFDVPPGRYVQQRRLDEAGRLLRETRLPIKSIARRVGYRELPNFYRAFRKSTQLAPGTYRQRWSVKL